MKHLILAVLVSKALSSYETSNLKLIHGCLFEEAEFYGTIEDDAIIEASDFKSQDLPLQDSLLHSVNLCSDIASKAFNGIALMDEEEKTENHHGVS